MSHPQFVQPIGSPDDIVIYDGVAHSRYYAVADMSAAGVPAAWIERTMAEARVIFAQPQSGPPVFFERALPCHDERGRFAPCGSEAAEKGEKAKGERAERKAKEKEEKANTVGTKAYREKNKDALKEASATVKSIRKEKTFPPPTGSTLTPKTPGPNASRVGVAGDAVPPPPKIPRLPNLTADERFVEDRFATAFERDPDGLTKQFIKDSLDTYEKKKGKGENVVPTFETDAAKMLSGDYNNKSASAEEQLDAKGVYNTAVHQTAHAIAKRAFVDYLHNVVAKLPEEKRNIIKSDGGCGSGKGYLVENCLGNLGDKVGAIYDAAGEQNSTENEWILDECKKAGVKPTFVFVHADPTTTWEDPKGGVISRAKGKGRMVDARLYADSYAEGAKNFKAFYDKHKDNPDCNFVCFDNTVRGTTPDGKPILPKPLDKFPEAALKVDAEKLYARSANYAAGVANLKPAIRRGATMGGRIWGTAKKSSGKKK